MAINCDVCQSTPCVCDRLGKLTHNTPINTEGPVVHSGRRVGKKGSEPEVGFHGVDPIPDSIGVLLTTLRGKLAAVQKHQNDESASLSEFLQRIANAIKMAELRGHVNPQVAVPPQRMLQAFRSANEERKLMTECMVILCELLGSIIVQVEPGTLETADGQKVLPFFGPGPPHGNDLEGDDPGPIAEGHTMHTLPDGMRTLRKDDEDDTPLKHTRHGYDLDDPDDDNQST